MYFLHTGAHRTCGYRKWGEGKKRKGKEKEKIELNDVTKILKDFCDGIDLQRYDLSPDRTEISFIVDIKNPNDISVFTDKIKKLGSTVSINLMDYQDLNEV